MDARTIGATAPRLAERERLSSLATAYPAPMGAAGAAAARIDPPQGEPAHAVRTRGRNGGHGTTDKGDSAGLTAAEQAAAAEGERFATQQRTRRPMPSNYQRADAFRRDRLPHPADYYAAEGVRLIGGGGWRDALCPFHGDTRPSMRIRFETGAFRCMVCAVHGGDIVAFHMQRHGLRFVEAVQALGAWEPKQ